MKSFIIAVILAVSFTASAKSDLPDLAKIKIAAEAGDAEAQFQFAGQCRSRGDSAQAFIWYRKAALQNHLQAQSKLGSLLVTRYDMRLDPKPEVRALVGVEALKWITLAANAGDKPAQADLAQLYLKGSLVKQNYVEAYKWGELAARGGQFEPGSLAGKTIRDAAILKMSKEQIEEAQKRVESFVPKKADASPAKPKTP